ncbi:MAG: hypothetical protein QOK40_2215, partial [Miltoncostaeaceae bacterium]|nr:hypothetical protein [Miltoncostaeaceae bacterium]
YRVPDESCAELNQVDDEVQAAAESGDEEAFERALRSLVDEVERLGTPVPAQELIGSDAIVPSPGTTLDEARALLSSEGLIPD